jgi:hypothetical protein
MQCRIGASYIYILNRKRSRARIFTSLARVRDKKLTRAGVRVLFPRGKGRESFLDTDVEEEGEEESADLLLGR